MDQKDQEKKQKTGLPEALHPEIGNGASWESDPNDSILRSTDSSKPLDSLLLDHEENQKIIDRWNHQLAPSAGKSDSSQEPDNRTTFTESAPDGVKAKRKEKKIRSTKPDVGMKPDWFENLEEEFILKEDPNKPDVLEPSLELEDQETVVQPEGKRVRKAIKKAQKQGKLPKTTQQPGEPRPLEVNLSPFTKWLKSLKGSEYVHPYEDDYALGQLNISNQEGISETFADLLATQGFKEQAIEMYKLLMAKNPEKSSFFAAKIEALK